MAANTGHAGTEQYVVFRLGSERFGISIYRVNEILRLQEITTMPKTSEHLRGILNLRGKTIPALDLRTKFKLPDRTDSETTRIIVVSSQGGVMGIVVDEVREVTPVRLDSIEQAPDLVTNSDPELIRGITTTESGLVTLLDLDRALVA